MLSLTPHILLAASFAAGVLAAIDFSSLPQCVQGPILNTIGRSMCDPSKPQCLCNYDVIVHDLVTLSAKSYSGNDLTKVVVFGRALCPNMASQSLATISDFQTTYVLTLDQPASTTAAPATISVTSASSTAEARQTVSASKTSAETPTVSVVAGNGTLNGNSTSPEEFQGHAPEFGPMRLWSTILGVLLMGAIFAEM